MTDEPGEMVLRRQAEALAMLRERERLARELQSTLGQLLDYAANQIQAVQSFLAQGHATVAQATLTGLFQVIREGESDLRALFSDTLRPLATGTNSVRQVIELLEQQLAWYRQAYGLHTTLDVVAGLGEQQLSPLVEAHLRRMVQEALANVHKHARASAVQVRLEPTDDGWLRLTIADDGCGFDPAGADHAAGNHLPVVRYGLASIASRAAEMGGRLQITSALGHGTTLIVTLPLQPEQSTPGALGRVLLVDNDPPFVDRLEHVLRACGYTVVGVACDEAQAVELAYRMQPDLMLIEIARPELDGLKATRRIKAASPAVAIVVLTDSASDDVLVAAFRSGVDGYLLKSLESDELLRRLQGLRRGDAPLAPGLAARVLRALATQPCVGEADSAMARLTPSQRNVLALVAEGHTYREVGARLGFTEDTIKKYMGKITRRLQVPNRAAAIAYARRYLEPASDEFPQPTSER